jgi:hypothetical protein
MSVVIDGTTGITAAAFDGAVDAADLTGTLPALNGSAQLAHDLATMAERHAQELAVSQIEAILIASAGTITSMLADILLKMS